ncbi:hypothetical protein N5P37_003111 [Trichoderma harzianum]|uniref:C2H2-type domain-containing protein n=1 Tax=Trichoderma harzianum CBS 226.95 TaxID=983964 RepID=A0A2T4ATC1_TRIHA|nr:hypothetical protein M431DRAFT_489072 [Trichoderma harzianum CBS 226.95]KAK0763728.1 hypothetical protein N5P37_003111 [Trichoderma harzianum]PTB60317.1 hypothetical protein M431DRAFT_489072 [Trichoderma harzianum CBS 226.95]
MPRKAPTERRSSKARTKSRRIPSRTPPVHGSSHEDQVGRPMVRFLLNTYSAEQINRMLDEESRSLSQSSSAPSEDDDEESTLLELEPKSVPSNPPLENKASPPPAGTSTDEVSKTSITTTSDTPVSQTTEKQTVLPTQPASTSTSQPVPAVENRKVSTEGQRIFACGCCATEEVSLKFSRAGDLRRHMDDTHQSLADPDYMNLSTSAYQQQQQQQQQPFGYQHAMQYMFNSSTMHPQQEQQNVADWSDPMQWTNFDGEDNKRLM